MLEGGEVALVILQPRGGFEAGFDLNPGLAPE
jgi:hypothetical protein